MRRIEGNLSKNGGSGSGRAGDTIKFCVKMGYKPIKMFSLLQRGRDALEMKKYNA